MSGALCIIVDAHTPGHIAVVSVTFSRARPMTDDDVFSCFLVLLFSSFFGDICEQQTASLRASVFQHILRLSSAT